MRTPFERPAFAVFFYGYAIVTTILGSLAVLVFPAAFYKLVGPELAMVLGAVSGLVVMAIIAQGIVTASIGYVIELIAKIEWNTRPADEFGPSYALPGTPAPPPLKRYYYIANGPLHGPFQAPEILELYRSGKVPNNARLYVEEAGNRRPLANWSEIGV